MFYQIGHWEYDLILAVVIAAIMIAYFMYMEREGE
jgi:hypothetical protein